jgi:hypothetical protein
VCNTVINAKCNHILVKIYRIVYIVNFDSSQIISRFTVFVVFYFNKKSHTRLKTIDCYCLNIIIVKMFNSLSFYDISQSLTMTAINQHSVKCYWIIHVGNMKLLLTPFAEIFLVSIGDNTNTFYSFIINLFSNRNTIIYLQLISSLFNQIDCKNTKIVVDKVSSRFNFSIVTYLFWFFKHKNV